MGKARDYAGICQSRITHPNPYGMILFERRECPNPCCARRWLAKATADAITLRIEFQPVIPAPHSAVDNRSPRKRREAMRTHILQRHNPVVLPEKKHRNIKQSAGEKLRADLVVPGRNIPCIRQIGHASCYLNGLYPC